MNRRWIATGATAAAIVVALAAAEAAQWPGIGRVVAWSVERGTGWAVQHEGCRARLITASWLACERFTLAERTSAVDNTPWIDGTQAMVAWRWGDLWRWRGGAQLHLREVRAQTLRLRLERDANGSATWQAPLAAREAPGEEARPPPRVDRLAVASGEIAWRDAVTATQLAIAVQSVPADAAASPQDVASANPAGWRATIDGRWRKLEMSLRASTTALLPLFGAQAGAEKLPLVVQGTVGAATIGFDGRAAALFGEPELDGAISIAGPSLARVGAPFGLTLPTTPPFELKGRLAHAGNRWQLEQAQAGIGRSRLGGDFVFDQRVQPPLLTGRLVAPRLLLADLGPSIGASARAARPAGVASERDRVLPDRAFNLPSLRAMQARLDIDIDTLDLGTPDVRPLREVRTLLTLEDGSLRLNKLNAVVAGGRLQGDTRLDERRGTALWSAKLRFDGVDISTWLPGVRDEDAPPVPSTRSVRSARAQAQPVAPREGREGSARSARSTGSARPARAAAGARQGAYVTGKLVADIDVRGSGRSTAQILSTLDGQADATIRDGTLSHLATEGLGLDLAQALGVMVRGDRALPLRCARVHLELRDGVATVGPALLDNPDSTLRAGGSINLAEETLALVVRSRPKDVSFLSLRSPVTVTGKWTNPDVGIDGRSIAGRVIGAAVLAATVAPLAALLPLFDAGEKPAGDPCGPSEGAGR